VSTPAAIPEPLPAPPVLDLPPVPILDVADIGVEFTFDQSGFPEAWTHEEVAPAADVALRLRYAELRLQKGFDELLSLGAISNVEHFGYQLDTRPQEPRQRGLAARERFEEALPGAIERDTRRQQSD
jgi:hypothetical protein